ncbi:MAG: ribonuclease P protein component [Streptococcaceae bacterium]|nr:ribonuclease P protein component [Streptococcaceae bacterium]
MKKSFRVKSKKDFDAIFKAKNSVANRAFIIYQLKKESLSADSAHFRVGISVSKKLGKAHVRVKIKRRIREIVRADKSHLRARDFVIIARPGVETLTFPELRQNLHHLLKKTTLLEK